MLNLMIAGNLGKDASYRTTQSGAELCSFPVACETGFGENKQTTWVDVTRWGKGAKGLSEILRKGSKVAVAGEMSTREHEGKTYIQCRADQVTIQGTPKREPDGSRGAGYGDDAGSFADEMDDQIPFLTSGGIW